MFDPSNQSLIWSSIVNIIFAFAVVVCCYVAGKFAYRNLKIWQHRRSEVHGAAHQVGVTMADGGTRIDARSCACGDFSYTPDDEGNIFRSEN